MSLHSILNSGYVIYTDKYRTGNLAVSVETIDEEPFCQLSVNLVGHPNTDCPPLPEDEFVLNHDCLIPFCESLLATLLSSGKFSDTGKRVNYGFCRDIPIWRIQ